MAVIALTSFAGSPGVTTAALALGVHWPRPVVVVEADVATVTTSMPGFFRSNIHPSAAGGLDRIAVASSRGALTVEDLLDPERRLALPVHALPLVRENPVPALRPGHQMWVVPGFYHLGILDGVRGLWDRLPRLFRSLSEAGIDVLVDLGRFAPGDTRHAVLDGADQVLLFATATMVDLNRSVRRAQLPDLAERLDGVGRAERYRVVLTSPAAEEIPMDGFAGTVAPVLGTFPFDPQGASVFSLGRPDAKPSRNQYRNAVQIAVARIDAQRIDSLDRKVG